MGTHARGSGVSLLGVSLKGLCAVCLLGFLLNADPRWSSNVKCKVQAIATSLSYKSNPLLFLFLSQITIAGSVGQGL
ncbi:hypothetical protein VNO78_22137 [Psophocarpus tetragonolobus]|uniref:Uncharacterized protein n=1 Tax=Psophocarpus tetragonolobus TaxID=3891 RepID=A0AAN9XIQ2_PSOTE